MSDVAADRSPEPPDTWDVESGARTSETANPWLKIQSCIEAERGRIAILPGNIALNPYQMQTGQTGGNGFIPPNLRGTPGGRKSQREIHRDYRLSANLDVSGAASLRH